MQPSRPVSSNGSLPPPSPRRPFWERAPRLSCAVAGIAVVAAFLALFLFGLAHPLIVLAAGAVMVAIFGGGLLLWKD